MSKFGKKNGDTRKGEAKRIQQQLDALERQKAKKAAKNKKK